MSKDVEKQLTRMLGELWQIASEGREEVRGNDREVEDWTGIMGEIETMEEKIREEGVT